MKKLFFLMLTIGLAGSALAQPDVTTAYNLNNQGKYVEAMEYIEKAASDLKATSKEKYWRYRGNIYLNISLDEALAAKFPDALSMAVDSYLKSKMMDKYGDYAGEVQASMSNAQQLANVRADKAFNSGDFCAAAKNFEMALGIGDAYGVPDSAAVFNTAYCYERCGDTTKAISGYERCVTIGYNLPSAQVRMAEIYLNKNDKAAATKILAEARARFPKDAELLRTEVSIYLGEGDFAKAEQILTDLTVSDPNNVSVWFVLGVTYGKLGKKADEMNAYKRTLEIDPNYFDALFNMGALYFNDGLEAEKICAEIPTAERSKYNTCIENVKLLFEQSVASLEKAFAINQDREVMSALKDAYFKAERMEDYSRMKALLAK